MQTPVLHTERMIFRPLEMEDAAHIYKRWTSDPEVAKYMVWDQHKEITDTFEWLELEQINRPLATNYTWGIILKETGLLIGSAGIVHEEKYDCFSLGYNLMKQYWGKGLATEIGEEILHFAQNTLHQTRFCCRHATENVASMRVMTKLGFVFESDGTYKSFSGAKEFSSKDYILEIK